MHCVEFFFAFTLLLCLMESCGAQRPGGGLGVVIRSKRGVEKKANYPNTRDKRSLLSMPDKRVPCPGFNPEDKKRLS